MDRPRRQHDILDDWRGYLDDIERAEVADIDARAAVIDAERRLLTDRRKRIMNRAVGRRAHGRRKLGPARGCDGRA